ncbi:MAG: outer membrane beta-barrel protein [Candidatus Sericytochromatia bacterium]
MALKTLSKYTLAIMLVLASPLASFAESNLDIRLDGDINFDYNSNLAQSKTVISDSINSYTGSITGRYLFPSQTQVLARLQGQYSKFITKSDFDRIMFTGSLNLSQWFFNSLNVYVGAQPIYSISLSSSRRPFDMLYLGGATYYLPFLDNELAYGGYQLDRLQAEAQDYRSLNHTLFLGLRHPFTDNFITYLGGRFKLRNLDNNQKDTNVSGNISAQYLINDWLSIQANGEYTQVMSSVEDRNVGFYTVGINLTGGLNNSFSF